MVGIEDIPDFIDGAVLPGQRPSPGVPPTVAAIPVVLVTARLDQAGQATPLNASVVDAFIAAEIAAERAYSTTVQKWSPWSSLDIDLGYAAACGYNYARITIDGRNFYTYLSAEYINLTTTRYLVTPDDCATYPYTLGYSHITRGHIAVAAAQNDPFGDLYMTAPEPIDAAPERSILDGAILNMSESTWKVLVVSANDLRGDGETPYFAKHVFDSSIADTADFASDATANHDGTVQVTVPESNYPWADTSAAGTQFRWPFDLSTFNMNNGHPEDNFRTAGRPTHRGMDMGYGVANVTGQPIKAAADGTVYSIENDSIYGHRVVILHDNGYRTTYNHMNAASPLAPYTEVTAGTTVGGIGQSGVATGNHLHFEVYNEGIGDYMDPLIFMATFNPDNLVAGSGTGPTDTVHYAPKVTPSPVSRIDGVAAGGGAYVFTLQGYAKFMSIMQGAPWVLGGLVDVRIIPAWAASAGGDGAFTPRNPPTEVTDPAWAEAAVIPAFYADITTGTTTATVLNNWRDTVATSLGLGVFRKLLTSQFTRIVVSDGESSHEFLPEVWKDAAVRFGVVTEATHGTPSIRAIPTGYTALGEQRGIPFAFGGKAGVTMAGRAMGAANTAQQDIGPFLGAYSNFTTRGVLQRQQALAIDVAFDQARLNMGVQGIQVGLGIVGNAGGGVPGMAAAAGSGIGNLATSAISAQGNLDILDMKNDVSFDIATYQLGLAGVANYFAYDSWVQSLDAIPGQGQAHTLAGAWRLMLDRGLDVMIVTPTADAIRRAVTTWDRYGYMIDRAFTPPRLDAMSKYTYWLVESPTILGAMPADARGRIAARFAAGTTVWTDIAEIGTKPANTPRTGIAY